ncbi:hypothetical protein AERO_11085 [Aeromicrobium fastidiosum]|uniref:hypothetical protein n=1 Tax=Aeromicrobium fastidiosum TaxID=52699 RepID=UPI00202341A1|nr:hypothetical protein [Aeromicrobium fastidiosum]MCL8251930.1 hypothetical protein [Aeromicrobium fastidiosum]
MRILAASAATVALLLASACGSDAGSGATSPEAAVSRLMSALEDGSCPDVQDVVVTPDLVDCEQVETLRGSYADDGVDLDDVSLSAGEVVDDSSSVTADLGAGQDAETWQVERVDGSWKVLFDSEE